MTIAQEGKGDLTMENDFVGREVAIQHIKDNQCKGCSDIGLCGKCAVLIALKLIEKAPAADVRPVVRVKWIRRSDDSFVATCSVCGEENQYAFCIMSLDEQSLVQQDMFCPKCGADMREVQSNG